MKALTKFSMKNVGLIFIAILLVFGGGLYSVSKMKMESLPNVDVPYLNVYVVYPGATPDQVLEDIAKPLESQLSGLKGLKNLYVTSANNYGNVFLEFEMSKKMDEAEADVNAALAKVRLPETAQKPEVHQQGPSADDVFTFAVDGGGADQAAVQQFLEEKVEPQLATVPGVSSVGINGTAEKKLFVRIDPDKLKEHNLTLEKVKQALLANNISAPTGEVTVDGRTMNVQVGKQLTSVEDVKNVNLILVEQNMSGMTDAFQQVGDGMGQLGQAVGQVGQAVGQLGGSVGSLAKSQALMQQQILIMGGINQVSQQMFADQMQLKELQLKEQASAMNSQDPKDGQTAGQIVALEAKIKAEQAKIADLQGQLTQVQHALQAAGVETQSSLQVLQQGAQANGSASQQAAVTKPNADNAKVALELKTLKLGDVAEVTYEVADTGSYTRLNAKPAVTAGIVANVGANTVEVVNGVKEKLAGISLPDGYAITELRDQSTEIKKSVNSMLREAVFGALLAAIVTLIFLRNVRATVVALLSIPLSILVTMIVMKWMDYSLNMMTLAGIAVAVGRVVDDSIVVIENLYRRIQTSHPDERDDHFVLSATMEVAQAITSSTVTTIAVFGPLAFVPGIVGKFFAPFAWSVVIALAFSLLIAVTVVPLMSRLFLMNLKPVEHKESGLQRGYRRLLTWSLGHKTIVVVICLALLGGTGLLVPQVPVNFFPKEEVKYYSFQAELPIGSSIEKANEVAMKVEKLVQEAGATENYTATVRQGSVRMRLTMKEDFDAPKFEELLREGTKDLGEGVETTLTGVGGTPGSGGGLFLVLNGPDLESMKRATDLIKTELAKVDGLADVSSNVEGVRPQVSIVVDDVKAAERGLNTALIMGAVRDMISGSTATNVLIEGKTTALNLGLRVDELNSLDKLAEQKITSVTGEEVVLGDVAKVEMKNGATSIQRLNQQEYVSISGKFTSQNSSGIQSEVEKVMEAIKGQFPEGVTYYFEGEAKLIGEGFTNMFIAIGVSIVLVYVVMMVAFGEMLAPLAILFSLPFIFVGAIAGLWLTDESLGMPALVGVLMLIGIVVTNAIVLIDRVMQNRAHGLNTHDALIEAGVTRIRPILMTAVATIGALVPLAVTSEGGLISRSLAIVVISGLSTSTLLTLLIVPIAYTVLDNMRAALFGKKKREQVQKRRADVQTDGV
ncbi:efflux RND transporter permease subunit [Tumebacillus sp. DT12]|uniref:Efflux RND transporter permease subunit n=1 Tax=Tumebacillus lacus TaxID=2995335 RepID=A0ABT3X4T9_9BACL|nr:efflux RND transporter permease subunit [Tumebacillus lacus]MCX7571922.1 efflux RND transporter permease subunit [Tumebacillus lacus]